MRVWLDDDDVTRPRFFWRGRRDSPPNRIGADQGGSGRIDGDGERSTTTKTVGER